MPDTLNKQAIINLLIDSPLREPIKINLIDIVNNTNEPDLPKVYSTITKELEIFQKATERRMKLAEETIAKLGGNPTPAATPTAPTPVAQPLPPFEPTSSASIPPLDLPPLPQPPMPAPISSPEPAMSPLTVPPLDLPPMPTMSVSNAPIATAPVSAPVPLAASPVPPFQPLGSAPMAASSDEDALAEIQKELDSLKHEAAADVASAAAPTAPSPSPVQQ